MRERTVRRRELLALLDMDEDFLHLLEREEIIQIASEGIYSEEEVDSARLARTLMKELDVNLEGVEVILHMRKNMIEMQRHFKDLLQELSRRLRNHAVDFQ